MDNSLPSGRASARIRLRLSVGIDGFLAWGCNQAIVDCLLARKFPEPAQPLRLFTSCLLRGLFVEPTAFHFPKKTFPLHLFLQDAKGLVDIVVANKDLQLLFLCVGAWIRRRTIRTARAMSSPSYARMPHNTSNAGPILRRDIRS